MSAVSSGCALDADRSPVIVLPQARLYDRLRGALDFAAAAVILIVLMPVIIVAMIAVRLSSPGPAIYRQRRVGRGGRSFTIYKIRTMIQDSELGGPKWCVPGDRRVTPVGRLLRWSHVDELPQLVNVLRGEMSLVGPRPERPEIITQLERVYPNYRQRLACRPGLSGLAQVLLPPDTEVAAVGLKLRYDLHYVQHISPWLDLKIGLATFFHIANVPAGWIARLFRFPRFDVDAKALPRAAELTQPGKHVSPALSA